MKPILAIAIIVAGLSAVPVSSAKAGTGDWFETEGAKLRLVSLRNPSSGRIQAALEIRLEPGWKTYWRSPGASGLPPQVDFSTSTNTRSAKMRYPVPLIFAEGQAQTAGYKGHTVFPIDILPGDPAADVTINARGLVGICEEICVPVQFQLSLLDSATGATSFEAAQAINIGQSRLPEKSSNSFTVEDIAFDAGASKLVVSARVPAGVKSAQLFLEGPARWYLEPATPVDMADNTARFEVSLPAGASLDDLGDNGLDATLVAGDGGVEQENIPVR